MVIRARSGKTKTKKSFEYRRIDMERRINTVVIVMFSGHICMKRFMAFSCLEGAANPRVVAEVPTVVEARQWKK